MIQGTAEGGSAVLFHQSILCEGCSSSELLGSGSEYNALKIVNVAMLASREKESTAVAIYWNGCSSAER